MRTVPSVGQAKTSTDRAWLTVHSLENFGGTHDLTPRNNGIVPCQYVCTDWAGSHVADQSVVEETTFVFSVKLFSLFSCEMELVGLNDEKLMSEDRVFHFSRRVRLRDDVGFDDGQGQLKPP